MIFSDEIDKEQDARHVFLLMGKEYRISRSIRAQWFFQQFHSTLPYPKPRNELISSNEELEILSVLPKDPADSGPYRLIPSTHITFIGRRYRFVFCLDISPSLATVDIQSGTVITDEAFGKFRNCLTGLVAPFSVPGNSIVLSPELYITVLAYTSVLNPKAPQVLIQGCLITEHNVNTVLEMVHDQLKGLEDFLANTTSAFHGETSMAESDQGGVCSNSVTLMSPEAGPISILRNALLALQLLPDNASAGAVVITDGVFALPDASAVDSLLAQLRASTVCCSFIKVGSGFHAHCSLGYVPHCDMMQFIAMATSGAYLAKAPPVHREGKGKDGDDHPMNLYHKALLCWNIQRDFDLSKIDPWIGDCLQLDEEDLAWPLKGKRSLSYALSEWEQNAMQPSMRKRHLETKLHTSITSVLSVRLREGYSIQDVSITKGGKQLQVRLTIPWKHNVQIEYLALAAWPLCHTNCTTHVEVTIEAPYEFLHDVMYPMKKAFTSGYRTLVVKRFRQAIKSLQSTDELLAHLQSFSSNSIYYTIPESAKNGVPLFYIAPNSSSPVLSLQHARKSSKSQESQFAVFWKPVLSMDTTTWQRWMHCHRIGLVLEHDVPLPKNLHLPAENDRFSAIQCRVALSSLNSLFIDWSSFVLLENHSYIKFIKSKSPEEALSSFCIARIMVRGSCIVIKVAFLGGTEGYIRHEIVSGLRSQLSQITAPLGQIQKPAKGKNLQRVAQLSSQRIAIEKPCAILYDKPLEKMLVRYERIPADLLSPYPEVPHYSVYDSLTGVYAHRTNENHMKVLCQYLHHHRWIWTMQDEGTPAESVDDVARILSTLTKLRLQEGFHFVYNSAGIITMAKELKMKDNTKDCSQLYSCVIQYVLFPPYHRPSETERAEEAVADWAYEGKPPLAQKGRTYNMVTEVWAEPQFGLLTDLSPELKYLEGLKYNESPEAIYQMDVKHVSALLTYDHLFRMCNDQTVSTPHKPLRSSTSGNQPIEENWVVEQLPFPFEVIGLLPKTRQVEMVFSSLIEASTQGSADHGESPNENLFKLLLENMERLNDREITLTEGDWQRFLQHIQGRERNGIPLPFPEDICPDEDSNAKNCNVGKPLVKWRCFIRGVTGLGCGRLILTFLPASLKYVRLMGRRGRRRSSSATSSPRSVHHTPDKEKTLLNSPDVFSHGSSEDRGATPTPSVEIDEGVLGFNQEDTDSVQFDDTGSQRMNSAELRKGHDDDKRSVTFKENTTLTEENPPFRDPCVNDVSDYYSFDIPIYCYDCPMSALITVKDNNDPNTTPEEAKKREDIFQDFTQSAAQIFMDPFSLDEVPRSLEGQTRGRFGASKDLLLHCNAVHDLFFRSFVSSTFTSLQRGQQVTMRDVHSAVDACEENFLEVDITEFIRTLCGHCSRNNKDKVQKNPQLVPACSGSNFTEDNMLKLRQCFVTGCESVPGLHKSIAAKFMSILQRFFKAVPPSGEFFFYCPQQQSEGTRKSVPDSFSDLVENYTEQGVEDDAKDAGSDAGSDVFDDMDVDAGILIDGPDGPHPQYDMDLSEFESEGSELDYEDAATEDDEPSKSPLFLQLTCSLRDRSSHGQAMTPVSIHTLPICLGEIIQKVEDDEECLDPFRPSVRITLDLICLTLSQEPDYTVLKSSARNAPSRSNSFSSTSSPVSLSPQDKRSVFDFRRQDSKATSHDIEGMGSLDPLRGLVSHQRQALNITCDAVRWLLQDEIVSELRHNGPVNKVMLEKVEYHVKQSEDHVSCISRTIPLQFVFGAEQSMELFVKEIEKFSLPEFLLNKVDEYYYLSRFIEKEVLSLTPIDEATDAVPFSNLEAADATVENVCKDDEQESVKWAKTREGPAEVTVNVETGEAETTLSSDEGNATSHDEAEEGRNMDDSSSDIQMDSQLQPSEDFEMTDHIPTISEPLKVEDTEGEDLSLTLTLCSNRQSLAHIGKQHCTEDELSVQAEVTPVRDSTFTSSAESTPVGSLFALGADLNKANPSNGIAEEEESPRTPRQDDAWAEEATDQFWLVMRIFDNHVDILFHQRESDGPSSFCATRANGLVETVTNAIHEKCRVVNQRMLLHELYETKLCNSMLFPESDEDIWKHEDLRMSVSPLGVYMSKGDSSGRVTSKYVQVQYLFQPGHFGCESVYHTHLPVHQRLRDSSGRPGISRGLKAIKSVLDRFGVSNRKDMFVYKESSGAVFYFRLFESLCEYESSHQCPLELRPQDVDEDDRSGASSLASLAGSRTPSQWSLLRGDTVEFFEDVFESKLKKHQTLSERDAVSVQSFQPVIEESIALHVYGVDEPGPEITVELVEVLQNRINEAMLEVLSVLISRNPNCKLTYADVRFIQPLAQPPKATLTFIIPPMDVNFLCPLSFYLRQNLLQFLHSPRYADTNTGHHFKSINSSKASPTGSNSGDCCRLEPEVYLYNRPHSSGGKGLACICASVLNSNGGYIHIPCGKTACVDVEVGELDYFEQMTEVFPYSDEYRSEDDLLVQFAVWERGDIALDQLSGHLKLALRHALCDLLIEYYLLTAPLSIVPARYRGMSFQRALPVSEPVTPTSLTPKVSKAGLYPESAEKTSKRQLEFSGQSGFRGRAASLAGHRRSPSNASLHSTTSSSVTGVTVRSQQNPFIVSRPGSHSENSVSRQSTLEDEVFKAEAMAFDTVSTAEEALEASMTAARTEQEQGVASEPNPEVQGDGAILRDLKPYASLEILKTSGESEKSSDLDPTFELFTEAEIQESQEFASLPGTPVSSLSENTAFALKKNETPSNRDNVRHLSPGGVQSSQTSSLNGAHSGSGGLSPAVQPTWQVMEMKRRNNQEQKRRRIQYENGEVGELHPSLQGLAQDMFTFFRQLGLLSVHSIEGKLINNFATDAFLNELVNLISLLCSDVKPKVYREAPYNSIDRRDIEDRPELNCLHYYPARQPLKVQDLEESSADKSGKLFAPTPDSSHFFVVVGRNVDQWRASLGREEDFTYDDSSGRPRIVVRTGLQRFKPLDPNAPVPGGRPPDSNSVTSLSAGGVPRQKFILVTVMDKDVIVFTYNWAVDLNNALDKQLNRLLHWSNARCHITSCLLSQKLGLFHHTLFADINNDKEGKEVNPFCFSTNDNDMVLLISRPAPPPPDRERAMPRQMLASPSILVFDEVLRDVTPPRPLHRTQYFLNRDPVKRHGYQFQEIRSVQIKRAILQQTLDELYRIWQQRPPHVQISEDKIEALKRSSRLIHYCAAPLLFHPRWRDKRAATELEKIVQEETHTEGPEKREKSKERKTSRDERNDTKKERKVSPSGGSSTREDAWHVELRSAYVQQYVQYMQSLQFIVVQTRPQSPRQSRRYLVRSGVNVRAKRESSPLESKKQGSSKDIKESQSKMLHCYLQRSSPGGIMLTELMFQGCFFIVRLYALECSQIPSGKTASVQMCRLFVEDCTRYREFIHLLSFNYDFHLCKAQMYLNGSQRIFNKGYGVTHMLRVLLQEYPECPVYARNRLCTGEIAVPCAATSSPRLVFSYMVKNASKYDFSTLSLETSNSKKSEHVLLGSERILKQIRGSETKTYDILRDNNEYDISLVVSLKDTLEQGVVNLEYLVVMTSRRELFPKLTLDWKLRKRTPSSCSLSSMGGGRKTSLPENGSIQEQEKGAKVRFVIPSSSSSSQFSTNALQSSGEFHRSASSPHSLCAMGSDTGLYMNLSPSLSDENIKEIRRDSLPVFSTLPSNQEDSSSDKVSLREARLLTEAFIRAHNHLVHVVCRAQTHCNRDLLWHRLFAGGSGEEEKEVTKKGRRKSEYKKPGQDSTASWNWKLSFDTMDLENDQSPPARLSFDEFKQLLSSVVCNSLKDEDPQLIPVLSMSPAWYLNLFRVMMAKFPDKHRLYVSEGTGVHYLAILNLSNPEMFVLLYVDEATHTTDIMTVFRDNKPTDGSSTRGSYDLRSKSARSHVYSVVNAVCFHLWTSLLPT